MALLAAGAIGSAGVGRSTHASLALTIVVASAGSALVTSGATPPDKSHSYGPAVVNINVVSSSKTSDDVADRTTGTTLPPPETRSGFHRFQPGQNPDFGQGRGAPSQITRGQGQALSSARTALF
jgi:hypothetical protein